MTDFTKIDNLIDGLSAQNAQIQEEAEKAGNPATNPLKLKIDRLADAERRKNEILEHIKQGGDVFDALKMALDALGESEGCEDLLRANYREYAAREQLKDIQNELAGTDPEKTAVEKWIRTALETQKAELEADLKPPTATERALDSMQCSADELNCAAFVLGLLRELVTRAEGSAAWQTVTAENVLDLIIQAKPAEKTRAKLKRKQKKAIEDALKDGEPALDVLVGALKLAGSAAGDSKFFAKCADPLERIYRAKLPDAAMEEYKEAKGGYWISSSKAAEPGISDAERTAYELEMRTYKAQLTKIRRTLQIYGFNIE